MLTLYFHVVKVAKAVLIISSVCLLSACLSLPNLNPFSDDKKGKSSQTSPQQHIILSEQEQAKRAALVAGKSSRPSLLSLDLQPARLQEIAVPSLSLVQKREQYAALLPLISDPIQKQQVAFRLADIKMLIAEQSQQEGIDLQVANASFSEAISDYRQVLNEYSVVAPAQDTALTLEQQALNRKQMDAMYQLTRALDLSAQPDQSVQVAKKFLATFSIDQFNVTTYHLELYFRIGEYYFNRQQYPTAANYYSQVLEFGKGGAQGTTNFYPISAYMLGWSHFKLDDYPNSMQAFATMLDASLLTNSALSVSELEKQAINELAIPKGELRLVKDAVRVMALTFSYQGNGKAIESFFEGFGSRYYEQLIYDELAQQHLDNDRFQDSANVLVSFAHQEPVHPRAIEFYIRHIDAFVLGDFPARVLVAKEEFVKTYSLGNGVVNSLDTPIGRGAMPYLRIYIKQLAQTEHSIAQSIDAILVKRAAIRATNSNKAGVSSTNLAASTDSGFVAQSISQQQDSVWRLASDSDLKALSRQAYTKAKQYYKNFIATFSPSPEVAPLRFYLAEALLALNEFEAAIEAFETFAYLDIQNKPNSTNAKALAAQKVDMPKPEEAAYAALLVYQKMAGKNPQPANIGAGLTFKAPLDRWQMSQAKFADTFASGARAPVVAVTLMQNLFTQQNYLPAQEWATWLLSRKGGEAGRVVITVNMQESAMLVMAHSYFAMDMFNEAQSGYRELLFALPPLDQRRQELTDRLAASLYKQAENLLLANKIDAASLQAQNISNKSQLKQVQLVVLEKSVALLQQVVTETPLSEFRLAAQYDSAVYFSVLENWSSAITTFLDFQTRYPQNPLTQGIDDQLFYAYQQTQDWPKAASILLEKYTAAPTTETGRLALYQAAEYFEKAGDTAQALDTYRRYAHQYPMPLAEANEARFSLSKFYLVSNEQSKRRFWLHKMVQAQQVAMQQRPKASTPRSVYLGSLAAMVFANDADIAYTRIKLAQPLAQSLQKKQAALKKAIVEFERVISFGSAEYVTAANYKLANLYTTLANDLMDSARPDGLSALELSQYEMLLAEQTYPFEETAIGLHEKNIARVGLGLYDDWVKASFTALKNTMPGRYNKPEVTAEVTIDDL
jgi:tetratricopeptide (TPR) repeat protein